MEQATRWRARPVLAGLLRAAIVAVPFAAGYGVGQLGAYLLATQLRQTRWWLHAPVAISLAVCVAVNRLARRALPLAALLKMGMLFPDRAPSRFLVARGAASTSLLNERVAHARDRGAAEVAATVLQLITAVTAHDRRTRGHCERVRVFTELLGEQLRLPQESRDKLRWAALLHDVGKLRVAVEILNKPTKLSDAEWRLVAEHPANGEELLGPLVDWLGEWGLAVRQHHERYDGTGYPDRLAGADISRAARIVALADSFEVMTAHRAYKKPMATVSARAELVRCAGTQFDPAYVRAFLSISLPRLLWTMGPGALLMNVPMLRLLAQTTPQALATGPQGVAAAMLIGGLATTTLPPHVHPVAPVAAVQQHAGPGSGNGARRGTAQAARPKANAAGQPVAGPPATGPGTDPGPTPGQSAAPPTQSASSAAAGRGSSATVPSGQTGSQAGTEEAPPPAGDAIGTPAPTTSAPAPVDSTAPSVTWTSTPPATLATSSVHAAFSVDDPTATAWCSLDGGPAQQCSGAVSYPALADGRHTIAVHATDPAGNSSATRTTSFTIAAAVPTFLSTPPQIVLLNPHGTFSWTAVPGLSYEFSLNGSPWATTAAPDAQTVTFPLLGSSTFQLRGTDSHGNHTAVASYTVPLQVL